MRGQAFTLDLFAAFGVFLVMLLLILVMSLWVADAIVTKEKADSMGSRAMAALDYLCYGEEYTTAPYMLDGDAIDAFFAQADEEVAAELRPRWEYSLKLQWLNGTDIHVAGAEDPRAANVIAYGRIVNYRGNSTRLIMGLWEERETEYTVL